MASSLFQISREYILDRLRFENPWWITGQIEPDFDALPRRLYLDLFKPLVYEADVRRAVVLMGPRRVGKTVMLYHLVEDMLRGGFPAKKILFVTIENPIYNNSTLEQLFKLGKEASGQPDESGWLVIFDEIQYCKNWEIHLKSLVDSYRKDKFIVSGSAAAALKFASVESGAGRFTDFMLPPLTFNEYIQLKGLNHLLHATPVLWKGKETTFWTSAFIDEFNRHFIDYINFGGYPEVMFSQRIQENPGRYIRHDIVDKVLLRDLPSLYGISDTRELNSLFTTIAYNTGNEFSLEALSRESQVQKITLKKYLEYLEAAFLIKIVRRIDQSGKYFKRDNFFKIYLTNPSLRAALFSPLTATDDAMGNMVETAVFSQWLHRESFTPLYARWNTGEVDLVGLSETHLKPIWAVEIKWSNRYVAKPQELKSLLKFCKENKLDYPLVTSIDFQGNVVAQDITLQFIPAASYAYTVGQNTLEMRML